MWLQSLRLQIGIWTGFSGGFDIFFFFFFFFLSLFWFKSVFVCHLLIWFFLCFILFLFCFVLFFCFFFSFFFSLVFYFGFLFQMVLCFKFKLELHLYIPIFVIFICNNKNHTHNIPPFLKSWCCVTINKHFYEEKADQI